MNYKIDNIYKNNDEYYIDVIDGEDLLTFKVSYMFIEIYHLSKQKNIDENLFYILNNYKHLVSCYNYALSCLNYHDYNEKKLKNKIINKEKWSMTIIEEVMKILNEKNLINDYDYVSDVLKSYLKKGYGFSKRDKEIK